MLWFHLCTVQYSISSAAVLSLYHAPLRRELSVEGGGKRKRKRKRKRRTGAIARLDTSTPYSLGRTGIEKGNTPKLRTLSSFYNMYCYCTVAAEAHTGVIFDIVILYDEQAKETSMQRLITTTHTEYIYYST